MLPPPLVFRVTRRDWLGFAPSSGHSPLPSVATWHYPPGEWRVSVATVEQLKVYATAGACDITIRPHLDPNELPMIVVDPLPSVAEMMRPPSTRARPRR